MSFLRKQESITFSVTPWLDHGVHKNNKKILIILVFLTGYRGQATV
ncbi:hypothetical protein [Rickettsia felis]|nr:hypothetical protein [Rickettsia felis]